MSPIVRYVILITTKPGRGQDQIDAFNRLAPIVRSEEGCIQYDMHGVANDPDRFVLIEQWSSHDALAKHDVAPHMVATDVSNKVFRAGPAEVLEISPQPLS